MKRIKIVAVILCNLLTVSPIVQAEESQPNRRYLNEVFEQAQRTGNIVYSEGVNNATGKKEQLTLRIFEPKDDKANKRALFVLTPGGGFIKHGDNWMDAFGEQMARAGYVVAINRYRLATAINSPETYSDALFTGVADQKAAIRFLLKDAQGENRYRIDPDNIFIGGHSAGAIISMHTAYLNNSDELDKFMTQGLKDNGGLDGTNGKDKTTFTIRGVINLSGLLTDLNILDSNEPPLLSIHGDLDKVVLIGSSATGAQGSIPIHEQAKKVGIKSELQVIRGGLHNDTAEPALCPECVPLTKRFIFENLKK